MKTLTTSDDPIYFPPRRVPFIERDVVDEQVHVWIDKGVIERSTSEYASQVVHVEKKDGSPLINHVLVTTGLPRLNEQIQRINEIIISVLSKMSLDHPPKWYPHVDDLQRVINSSYQRSVGTTPYEVLIGTKMKTKSDRKIKDSSDLERVETYVEERVACRMQAKGQIKKVQKENKRTHNLRRKRARKYKIGDLVAIKWTQCEPGLKLKSEYLGPYHVTNVKNNDGYEIIKDGSHESPMKTITCAEFMKPWTKIKSEWESGSDPDQNGRMWDPGIAAMAMEKKERYCTYDLIKKYGYRK